MAENNGYELERLQDAMRHLETVVADKEREILSLKTDLAIKDSMLTINAAEIKGLNAVIARNLTRTHAETAVAAAQIAQATVGNQPRPPTFTVD